MLKKADGDLSAAIKFTLTGLLLSVLCIFFGYCAEKMNISENGKSEDVFSEKDAVKVIIDAGHGGIDGGAVGEDGTLEKNLNLEVAKKVSLMLSANGTENVMTRTEDVLLYDLFGDFPSGGKKKMYDLKNRVRFAEEYENAVFVSIHMNSFPDNSLSGLQVYYSANSGKSEILAENVQNYVRIYLQNENKREIKRATDSIYILDRIKIPAVLIECGFISNSSEREQLKNDEYQNKLALVISSAVSEYVSCERDF